MIRSIVRAVLPVSLRERLYRVRKAWNPTTPMILAPTYAEDGLISQHVAAFQSDLWFTDAYSKARTGISWTHPGEIKFRAYVTTWAAEQALGLNGDFVECGVGHGIYSKTICHYVDFGRKDGKHFYLYDTFRGVPVETLADENERAKIAAYNSIHYSEDLLPEARKRFAEFPNVVIVPGTVPDSLTTAPDKVAYLSIDMNNATAEMAAIAFFWDRLVPGALVVLDDYAYGPEFLDQKKAWDSFARGKGCSVLTLPTGQGLIVKRPPT